MLLMEKTKRSFLERLLSDKDMWVEKMLGDALDRPAGPLTKVGDRKTIDFVLGEDNTITETNVEIEWDGSCWKRVKEREK